MTGLAPKKKFHEQIADQLIKQLEAGTAPWLKPWKPGEQAMPYNAISQNRYRGANALFLTMQGRSDPRWMTYKQAQSIGAQVKKGEKGALVQYWQFHEEVPKLDAKGKPVIGSSGKSEKIRYKLERPRVFNAVVFNGEQIDGLKSLPPRQKEPEWQVYDRVEKILRSSGANICHVPGDRAYYHLRQDRITLPERSQFDAPDKYYAIALHELGHWTGHESRLGRDLANPFGSEAYAREELRAEIASLMIGNEVGVGHDPGQHAAYVGNWIKILTEDPLEIVRAASDAEKIFNLVMNYEQMQQISMNDNEKEAYIVMITQSAKKDLEEAERDYQSAIKWVEEAEGSKLEEMLGEDFDESIFLKESIEKMDILESAYNYLESTYNWLINARMDFDQAMTFARDRLQAMEMRSHFPQIASTEAKVDEMFQAVQQGQAERTYLTVPFPDKDEVKALGAKWDKKEKTWYVSAGMDLEPFAKWLPQNKEKIYLAVLFSEKEAVKKAGAKWDKQEKAWYVPAGLELSKFAQWLPGNRPVTDTPAISVRDEFKDALKSLGCLPDGDRKEQHPIMDGKHHRIPVTGDNSGERSGFYFVHTDGRPAGFIQNNKTGESLKWKSNAANISKAQLAAARAEATKRQADREKERNDAQEKTAAKVACQFSCFEEIITPTPYMQAKGIDMASASGLKVGKQNETIIPVQDVNGKHWTNQYIQEDGTKRFAKDSKKDGCFHAIGGIKSLEIASCIIVCEGFATGASIKQAFPEVGVVVAFDSGNLLHVAKDISKFWPDKPKVIAGDDDAHAIMTHGKNVGREKAEDAAKEIGAVAVVPVFSRAEKSWPNDVPRFTLEQWRKGNISDQQKEALSVYKALTDFNDLGEKSSLGAAAVKKQIGYAISRATERHKEQIFARTRVNNQTQNQEEKPVQKRPILDHQAGCKVKRGISR